MVEFGLLLPVLVLLLMGAADFSRVFYAAVTTTNAARAGAGYGIESRAKSMDFAGMRQAALDDAQDITGAVATAVQFCECPDGSSIGCTQTCVSGAKRIYVRVTTTKTFRTVGLPSSFPLSATAVMRAQ
jgi:Flp pilus assembly protein TadG